MKNILPVCFLGLLISTILKAQVPPWTWARSSSGSGDIQSQNVAADNFGNVFYSGWYYGTDATFGALNLGYSGDGDVFLVKYDSSGSALWAKRAGGTGFDESRSVATDADGNVYVTGLFDGPSISFDAFTLTNADSNSLDMFIAKYDSSGNVVWAKNFGGSGREFAEGVTVDRSGNIYVTGSFESATLVFDFVTLTNAYAGSEDIYTVKFDPAGNVLWARSGSGTGLEWGICIATDPFGNVYTAGPFYSDTLSFDGNILINPYSSFGYQEMFIVKYDSSGNVIWTKLGAGNNYYNEIYSLAADQLGNLFVVGTTTGDTVVFDATMLTNPLAGYYDMFIVKLDASGSVLWGKLCGGYDTDYGYGVSTDPSGNAYVVGYFVSDTVYADSIPAVSIDPLTYSDLFLIKFDAAGIFQWGKGVGGIFQPWPYGYPQQGLASDGAGNFYTTGSFLFDPLVFGDDTLLMGGANSNAYIARISDLGNCSAAFGIYPDSSTQHLYWILNQATGTGPLTYLWNWGDGNFDTTAYPSHTYAIEGFYPICLTITDSVGCTSTYCHTSYLQRQAYHEGSSNTMVYVNVVASLPVGTRPDFEEGDLSVYPNPATGYVTIHNNFVSIRRIEIFNLIGERIVDRQFQQGLNSVGLDASVLGKGIFLLSIETDEGRFLRRLIRQ